MFRESYKEEFRHNLLQWFDENKRDLPWRLNRDPYRVWVSEIMLQQTRVAAVIGYYERFLSRFPNVQKLANAKEASVLAAWSGLGYYRRARSLQSAAKLIVHELGGHFPDTSAELMKLPGIGRYTAAAIASISFGEPCAVVDGNVERVLSRVVAKSESREQCWSLAQKLLSPERPGDFNQAMMELGATVCIPAQPSCETCPVIRLCRTKGPAERKKPEVRHKKQLSYALVVNKGRVRLQKRSKTSTLMPGMWELPPLDLDRGHEPLFTVRHSITDTDYSVRVAKQSHNDLSEGQWVSFKRMVRLPLTGVARKILLKAGLIEKN